MLHYYQALLPFHPPQIKILIIMKALSVISSCGGNVKPILSTCDHEETVTRLLLHTALCTTRQSSNTDQISGHRCSGPDSIFLPFPSLWWTMDCIWDKKRTIGYYQFIHLWANLGEQKVTALQFFNAFTGCNTCSSFSSTEKKKPWDPYAVYPEVTEAFADLSDVPASVSEDNFHNFQRHVILLYGRRN